MMRKTYIFTGILAFLMGAMFFAVTGVSAQFNEAINYQGKLTDSGDLTVPDGTYEMTFRLYATSTGGAALWTENWTGGDEIQVTSGLFSVLLGSITSLSGVDFDQELWLSVEVEGDGEMTPRKMLGAVPAAFVAQSASELDGFDSSQFLRSDEADTMSASSSATLLTINQTGSGSILDVQNAGTSTFVVDENGNVGIGTDAPESLFTLRGTGGEQVGFFGVDGLAYDSQEGGNEMFRYFIRFDRTDDGSFPFLTNRAASGDVAIYTGTAAGGAENEHFRIEGGDGTVNAYFTDANVGIGTNSPSELLRVQATSFNNARVRIHNDSTLADAALILSTSVTDWSIGVDNNTSDNFVISQNVSVGSNPVFAIDVNGDVGVGDETSPETLLHVNDTRNALTDVGNAANYLALLDYPSDSVGVGAGLGFRIDSSSLIGASIIHESTGSNSQGNLQFYTKRDTGSNDPVRAMTIDQSGNVLIGGSTTAGASAAGTLHIFEGTAPSGSPTNGIVLYAVDQLGTSELLVRDGAGNVTGLSPHNFSLIEEGPSEPLAWAFYSERNERKINVDMLRTVRLVEALSGERLVYGDLEAYEGEGVIQTVEELLERVENLENIKIAVGDAVSSVEELASLVLGEFKELGVEIEKGIARFGSLFAKEFTVGSQDNPTGITLFDTDTGEPYCIEIRDGEIITWEGACEAHERRAEEDENGQRSGPMIALNGESTVHLAVGELYDDPGILLDEKSTLQHILVGGVEVAHADEIAIDTSKPGEHTIVYTAIDSDGNETEVMRTVIVEEENGEGDGTGEEGGEEETGTSTATTTDEETDTATPTEETVTEDAASTTEESDAENTDVSGEEESTGEKPEAKLNEEQEEDTTASTTEN